MPKCINCLGLDDCIKEKHKYEISPIRRCTAHMTPYDLELFVNSEAFKNSNQLLEIGFGANGTVINSLCRKLGIEWYGLDPRSKKWNVPNGTTGTVDSIPFNDGKFGAVFSTHSVEHWAEHTSDKNIKKYLDVAINEIRRVLCLGGLWLTIVPIGYRNHGHSFFYESPIGEIKKAFKPESWSKIDYEDWRLEHFPLKPFFGAPNAVTKSTIWNLNIIATK